MNYTQAIAHIESLSPTALNVSLVNIGLERMTTFMKTAGNPQDSFASIHVGGTNGKGSVVAILDSVLNQAGFKVGRFIGPHLLRWNERFHINGVAISNEKFAALATWVKEQSERFARAYSLYGELTWFEFLTAMAFQLFAEEKVDIAVIEVGLGGSWDATNVLTSPIATVLTTIDLDHTHILGATVEKIAKEKAGIIKAGIPIITTTSNIALEVVQERAKEFHAPLFCCAIPNRMLYINNSSDTVMTEQLLAAHCRLFPQVSKCLCLAGKHQVLNALAAYTVLVVLAENKKVNPQVLSYMASGFASVYWPGRLQYLPRLNLIMDGAHNPSGAVALRIALDNLFPEHRKLFVFSFYKNKDVPGFLSHILRKQDIAFVGEARSTRPVLSTSEIKKLVTTLGCRTFSYPSLKEALEAARKKRQDNDLIIATGSFASVRETMQALGWEKVEDGLPETKLDW